MRKTPILTLARVDNVIPLENKADCTELKGSGVDVRMPAEAIKRSAPRASQNWIKESRLP